MRLPRIVWTRTILLLAGMTLVSSGCSATAPLTSPAEDAEAKLFKVAPHKSNIYVVRTQYYAGDLHEVAIDGGARVSLVARTYAVFPVDPGVHSIDVYSTMNRANLTIETREGANYFISMGMGSLGAHGRTKATVNLSRLRRGLRFATSVVVLPEIAHREFERERT
ncbi:MAG: hypothetical protein FJY85_20205 [Deltaproteobacteria bacterium]|nr:hypothetical protein [Deltaproteobacteria bacterium]